MSKNLKTLLIVLATAIVAGFAGVGIDIAIRPTETVVTLEAGATLELSEEQIPAALEGDLGEVIEDYNIPTVEEVDGGQFEDEFTGVSSALGTGTYDDLGWSGTYDTSSIEAFKDATLGKCIVANNRYGAQCVSLVRAFWWSYADRDVATCGTGMAKGMMECADENAGEDFEVHWGSEGFGDIAGDVGVWGNGLYGHTAIALGPTVNGYAAVLGENQGGAKCYDENGNLIGGAATNIINLSVKYLIGYYRPIRYIPEPEPEPAPLAPDTGVAE